MRTARKGKRGQQIRKCCNRMQVKSLVQKLSILFGAKEILIKYIRYNICGCKQWIFNKGSLCFLQKNKIKTILILK
jgi:hypothetical protein